MKNYKIEWLILFSLFLSTNFVIAQKYFSETIIKDFKETKNDSLFIIKNSDYPYAISDFSFIHNDDTNNQLFKDLYKADIGTVHGPYQNDTTEFYIKVLRIDSGYKARVGNIWINGNKGHDEALELANHILEEVQSGEPYNIYCIMYSDDKNKHEDCDLNWFYTDVMVKPFGEEVIKHKKDDVYIIETKFGLHVVKSLENPIRDKQTIYYVRLAKKK